MFISIHDLELRPVDFAESYSPGHIDFGEELTQTARLEASGRAELLEEHHGGKARVQDIRIVGNFSTQVELKCARCLDPVSDVMSGAFDLLYRPVRTITTSEEISLTAADIEISYYQGEGLQLEDVVKEQVLLAVPLKVLCTPECKGLCPQCGQNRNNSACDCKQEKADPRWAALADIKDKLKH